MRRTAEPLKLKLREPAEFEVAFAEIAAKAHVAVSEASRQGGGNNPPFGKEKSFYKQRKIYCKPAKMEQKCPHFAPTSGSAKGKAGLHRGYSAVGASGCAGGDRPGRRARAA